MNSMSFVSRFSLMTNSETIQLTKVTTSSINWIVKRSFLDERDDVSNTPETAKCSEADLIIRSKKKLGFVKDSSLAFPDETTH